MDPVIYIYMLVGSNVYEKYAACMFRVGVTYVRVLPSCIGMYALQASRWRLDVPPGRRWRSWLRHCAKSRKVAGSIPDDVIGIFHLFHAVSSAIFPTFRWDVVHSSSSIAMSKQSL